MKIRRKSFTLVEVLVVVAIATLLFGLVLPAFEKLVTGNSTVNTTNRFKQVAEQARSRALSTRKYVAVVIDSEGIRPNSGGYQAIRCCYVQLNGSDFEFTQWVPDLQWSVFDRGALYLGCGDDSDFEPAKGGTELEDIPHGELKKIKISASRNPESGDDMELYGFVYNRYGAVASPEDQKSYFVIGEATITGTGDDRYILNRSGDADSVPANSQKITLNPFTGRMEISLYED